MRLINLCITTSTWPTDWKLGDVCPSFKKEDPMNKSNYRPITILSAIPKLLEKVKYDQLYEAFSPIFSTNMSGFLRGHSCCSALIKMTDDWRLALYQKKIIGTVAIYLSKAFDSIYHNLLLAKFIAYGVSDTAVQFLCSYLEGRKQ